MAGKAKDSGMSKKYAREVTQELHRRGPGALSALPARASSQSPIKGKSSKLMKAILLAIGLLTLARPTTSWAQTPNTGNPVRINAYPTSESPTSLFFYDGSSNLQYVCYAQPIQSSFRYAPTWAITPTGNQLTLTSIVVATNVATATVSGSTIKLQVGNKITVAGSPTAAVNGSFIVASTPSSTTITYADTVADGTYNTAAITLSSTAPRSDDPVWSILKMTYNGSNLLTNLQWADGSSGNYGHSCDARATQVYQ